MAAVDMSKILDEAGQQVRKAIEDATTALQVGTLYAEFMREKDPAETLGKFSDERLAQAVEFAGWLPVRLEEERLRRAPGRTPDPEPMDVG